MMVGVPEKEKTSPKEAISDQKTKTLTKKKRKTQGLTQGLTKNERQGLKLAQERTARLPGQVQ